MSHPRNLPVVSVALDPDVLAAVDRVAVSMGDQHRGARLTRSDAIRHLLLAGLAKEGSRDG